ncbi:alpha/beta fold hydrolase [Rhodococcus gannanensis]|uniref:Alpha/beta fold hydrolase n=1 Tax=Rhodococcus gannanensis TaxID=1960308 RepID=A0ABW4PAT9_9NOCA
MRSSSRRILLGTVAVAAVAGAATALRRRKSVAGLLAAGPNPALADPVSHPEELSVVSADGHRIHVLAYGDPTAPPIVFAHGWTCSTMMWFPQINEFAENYRVIAYDQRGHGRSELGAAAPTPAMLGDDLDAVLSATVPDGTKAVVVGHSMGGMSVMSWALRHPDRVAEKVSAVMLASTGADRLVSELAVIPKRIGIPPLPIPVARAVLGAAVPMVETPLTRRALQYVALAPGSTREEVAFTSTIVHQCAPATRAGWGRALSELNVAEALDNLVVPTTVVVGDADRLTPPVHSVRMADRLDAHDHLARLIRLPGIGHMSTIEAAAEVNAEIRRLRSL